MRVTPVLASLGLLASSSVALAADYVEMSGKDLYVRFCASCHGASGRGDGPVASSFKAEVPDLTLIAQRAKGAYPRDRIDKIIDGLTECWFHLGQPPWLAAVPRVRSLQNQSLGLQ